MCFCDKRIIKRQTAITNATQKQNMYIGTPKIA